MSTLSVAEHPLIPAMAHEYWFSWQLYRIGMLDYVTIDAIIMLDFITRSVSNISYLIPINK